MDYKVSMLRTNGSEDGLRLLADTRCVPYRSFSAAPALRGEPAQIGASEGRDART